MGPTPKERKALNSSLPLTPIGLAARRKLLSTLSSSLPLILSGPVTRKGKSFHARVILCLFPSRTINWCYQFPSLSSFDCRLSIPLLSVNRFYFGAEGAFVKFWKELVLVLMYRSQISS
ncbi:uncharacterized protein LOC126725897 [Quercus robur]|uniref:uncharacterized protein LOC126725897 n=1 Tax=Quercus robur TaxID=38942 RepID=UPI0021628F1C|nr:uncharacterized protein LOC126725897 [Quercus robur]